MRITKKEAIKLGKDLLNDFRQGKANGSFSDRFINILSGFDNCKFSGDGELQVILKGGRLLQAIDFHKYIFNK